MYIAVGVCNCHDPMAFVKCPLGALDCIKIVELYTFRTGVEKTCNPALCPKHTVLTELKGRGPLSGCLCFRSLARKYSHPHIARPSVTTS